jgi:hypothetical protein
MSAPGRQKPSPRHVKGDIQGQPVGWLAQLAARQYEEQAHGCHPPAAPPIDEAPPKDQYGSAGVEPSQQAFLHSAERSRDCERTTIKHFADANGDLVPA